MILPHLTAYRQHGNIDVTTSVVIKSPAATGRKRETMNTLAQKKTADLSKLEITEVEVSKGKKVLLELYEELGSSDLTGRYYLIKANYPFTHKLAGQEYWYAITASTSEFMGNGETYDAIKNKLIQQFKADAANILEEQFRETRA